MLAFGQRCVYVVWLKPDILAIQAHPKPPNSSPNLATLRIYVRLYAAAAYRGLVELAQIHC